MAARIIDRRLIEWSLSSWRPLRRQPLTYTFWRACLQWCRAHSNWNLTDRSTITFSDWSCFKSSPDNQLRRVWRCSGQQWDTHLTITHHIARQPVVKVSGTISLDTGTLCLSTAAPIEHGYTRTILCAPFCWSSFHDTAWLHIFRMIPSSALQSLLLIRFVLLDTVLGQPDLDQFYMSVQSRITSWIWIRCETTH